MKTINLYSNGAFWVELRQDGKRFLVKRYDLKRITRMKWFRNISRATDDFIDVCGLDESDIKTIFRSEKRGGEINK